MTDDNNENKAVAAFDEATGKDALSLHNPDVVDYQKLDVSKPADAARKAKMDEIIASVHKAMDENTLTVVSAIDKEPSDRLIETSKTILSEIDQAGSFLGAFDSFTEKLAKFDFTAIGKMAKDFVAESQRKTQLAAMRFSESPFAFILKKIAYFFTGMTSSKSTLDDLRHTIDKNLLEFGEVIGDLEKANDQIPSIEQRLDRQEDARLQAYSDYGLYVGAVREAYRQWKEEKIPALKSKAQESGSQLDLYELKTKQRGVVVINSKLTSMDTFHKSSLGQLETISDMKDALVHTQANIINHLTTSQANWYAFASEAKTSATISRMAEDVQKADRLNDEIFEQSEKLSQLTTAMARASLEHGTLDPQKVVEFLQRKKEGVIESMKFVEEVNKRFENNRALLDKAAKDFMAAKLQLTSTDEALAAEKDIKLLTYQPGEAVDMKAEAKEKAPVKRDPQP